VEYSNEKISISISEVSEDYGRTHTKPYAFFRQDTDKSAAKNRIYSLLLDIINEPFDNSVVLQLEKRAILVEYKTVGYVEHPDYVMDVVNVIHKELYAESSNLQSQLGELKSECNFDWVKSFVKKVGRIIEKVFSKLDNTDSIPTAPEYKSSKQEEKSTVIEYPEELQCDIRVPQDAEHLEAEIEVSHVSQEELENSSFYKIAKGTQVVDELQGQKEEGLRKILSESDIYN